MRFSVHTRGVVEPKGGGLHGGRTRAGESRAAARLGGAQGDRLVDPVAPAEEPESGQAGGCHGGFQSGVGALALLRAGDSLELEKQNGYPAEGHA